jgi:hypothetical protein
MKCSSLKIPLKVFREKIHKTSKVFSIGGIVVGGDQFPLVVDIDDRKYCFDMNENEATDLISKLEGAIRTMKGN